MYVGVAVGSGTLWEGKWLGGAVSGSKREVWQGEKN